MIFNYTPLNYGGWVLGDEAREGVNIKKLGLMNECESEIWNNAVPYQDKRDDPGQAEIVTYSAIKLLEYIPGKREIVVPSAILHDIGWYGNDPQLWDKLMEKHKGSLKSLDSEAIRRPRQNRGLLLAGRVLEKSRYFENHLYESWLEIADIIGDHDTKQLPTTENGKIMRAADLMWRMSYPHAERYFHNCSPEEVVKNINDSTFSLSDEKGLRPLEKRIARIELANTLKFKFKDEVGEEISREFSKEFSLFG